MTQEQYAAMTPDQQAAYWAQWQYYQQCQQQQWGAPDYAAQQYAQYAVRGRVAPASHAAQAVPRICTLCCMHWKYCMLPAWHSLEALVPPCLACMFGA